MYYQQKHRMLVNGLSAYINTPPAPKGDGVFSLPPYSPQEVYEVDEYLDCPENWMHGSHLASSYFMPVAAGRHLWLDFNELAAHHHHVAIVISVQGLNPITGQPITELCLEQYRENCPKHNNPFGQDRFCDKCGFAWAPQNYLSTTCAPSGLLWIDGWRTETGTIRGFIITAETIRGVASQVLGDDRVFAIGAAFYLSKEPKPQQLEAEELTSTMGFDDYHGPQQKSSQFGYCSSPPPPPPCHYYQPSITTNSLSCDTYQCSTAVTRSANQKSATPVSVQKLEVGAGVRITQNLDYFDMMGLEYYQSKPAGMLYVNYASPTDVRSILCGRRRKRRPDGFLDGLKVGNS